LVVSGSIRPEDVVHLLARHGRHWVDRPVRDGVQPIISVRVVEDQRALGARDLLRDDARLVGNGWLANTIGNPLETTIALEHLIFESMFDRFPHLKILAALGCRFPPSYAPRVGHSCFVSPQNCKPGIHLKKQPTEYLRQMHYDALVFTPEALRHLVVQVGVGQVVLGTDFLITWELHPVDTVLGAETLSAAEVTSILGGDASQLMALAG
jgi:hypothetical protein